MSLAPGFIPEEGKKKLSLVVEDGQHSFSTPSPRTNQLRPHDLGVLRSAQVNHVYPSPREILNQKSLYVAGGGKSH